MKKIFLLICVAISLMANEPAKNLVNLSTDVKALLSQEMLSIEASMKNILSHMVAGEYEAITQEATGIQNSFILKKTLSDSQRKELHKKLPSHFIQLDRDFHKTAGKLANAAEFDEKDNVNKHYIEMINMCIQCHSTYAAHKFNNFKE